MEEIVSTLKYGGDPDIFACQIVDAVEDVEEDPLRAKQLINSIVDTCYTSEHARVRYLTPCKRSCSALDILCLT